MRLSEILGKEVVTTDGRSLGHVHDVRLVQDGPVIAEWGAAFRVHELAVGRRSFGTRLGYDRGEVDAPWLVKRVVGPRPARHIPWSAIREHDDERMVVELDERG
jgi:hypothetical protein